jgi:hypothetical protein
MVLASLPGKMRIDMRQGMIQMRVDGNPTPVGPVYVLVGFRAMMQDRGHALNGPWVNQVIPDADLAVPPAVDLFHLAHARS